MVMNYSGLLGILCLKFAHLEVLWTEWAEMVQMAEY